MIKRVLPITVLLLGAIFMFTTSSSTDKSDLALAEAAFSVGDHPSLPNTPYDYDIFYPAHSQSNFYYGVDTADLNRQITPNGATLGRVLFYDKKLSFTNQLSCASCHKQELAFADDAQFSKGNDGALSVRNSPNLNDLSWGRAPRFITGAPANAGMFFWDARESFLEDMVLKPISHEDELGKDLEYMVQKLELIPYYADLFENAFGTKDITPERVGSAIAQFVNSMSPFDSKFDRFMMGDATALNTLEKEGRQIMKDNCASQCHGESNFSSAIPMNNGLDAEYEPGDDIGVASYTGKASDIGKFKSPSLRNIEVTAPYMHDGRFNTLEEVIDFYSDDVRAHVNADFGHVGEPSNFTGYDFTDHEKEALIAFLKSMTTPGLLTADKWSDPFEAASSTEEEALSAAITVFPNPVAESFTIDLGDLTTEPIDLRMFDHKGSLVWKDQTTGGSVQTFETNKLPTGVYVLQMVIDGTLASKKLLIQ